jgi:RNA 2',3'-cyclic 3'-phosphodiesterase
VRPWPRCIWFGRFLTQSGNTRSGSVGRDERRRLFIGLRLPEDTLGRLEEWQHLTFVGVRDVRIVPRENVHVTLAFLGHRPAGELEEITQSLRDAAAAASAPSLRLGRYGETRSVGMLVFDDEEGRASALAGDLHGRLETLGVYERERRPWLPHVTVVRFRRPPRLRPKLPDLGEVSPSEAAVYHSLLRRGGAQYEALETVRLGGG